MRCGWNLAGGFIWASVGLQHIVHRQRRSGAMDLAWLAFIYFFDTLFSLLRLQSDILFAVTVERVPWHTLR